MMWLLAGGYCFILWLVFDKLRLLRLSLPIAIIAGSVGPALILMFLFCAQYYHPCAQTIHVFQEIVPVVPQLNRPGRVTKVDVEPNVPVKAGDVLFEVDKVPYEKSVERLTAALAEAEQGVEVADSSVEIARSAIERGKADLEYMTRERARMEKLVPSGAASPEELEQVLTRYQRASVALQQSELTLQQQINAVDVARSRVTQAKTMLDDAQYDLEQTVVRAPAAGYVTNLQLQPGMLVGGAGALPVMSFVSDRKGDQRGIVVAMFAQKNYLLIKPGQYAEVVVNGYPGRVFSGRVETVIDVTAAGQLSASGELPKDTGSSVPTRFAVRIRLDDGDSLRLPAGASGQAAVYTEHVSVAGIPIMFVMRAQSWLKYLF